MTQPTKGYSDAAKHVCSIVVTLNPDARFTERIAAIASQVGQVFLVDNGSEDKTLATIAEVANAKGYVLISNATNRGIPAALNQGVKAALAAGFTHAVTLDQDSKPEPRMVSELLATLAQHPRPHKLAAIGPTMQDPTLCDYEQRWLRPRRALPFLFQRVSCAGEDLQNVTTLMTSGSLLNLEICLRTGLFEEGFFVDHADTEYCLRTSRLGYEHAVSARALLCHRRGDRRRARFLGVTFWPTFHSPQRLYYIWRNRTILARRYALQATHWVLFDAIAAAATVITILLVEDAKITKLSAIARGALDGLKNRSGPVVPSVLTNADAR